MKHVFFLLCTLTPKICLCMDQAIHSVNLSKPLYNYCMIIGSLDPKTIALQEARNLYEFLDSRAQSDPMILTLTAQELSANCLDDVYLILHNKKLVRESIPTRRDRKQLIEESARSIESLLDYLVRCATERFEH